VNRIEPSFDPIKTCLDLVDTTSLAGHLSLKVPDLGHDMTHRPFKRGDTRFDLGHLCFELVDNATNVPQMLQNDALGFVGHVGTLANPGLTRQSILFKRGAVGGGVDPAQ
jgi:hypothetical protein